jgi:hypothetical protein
MQLDLFGKEAIIPKEYDYSPYHKKEILLRHKLDSLFRLVWDLLKKNEDARNCDYKLAWLAWTNGVNDEDVTLLLDFYKFKELQQNYNLKTIWRQRRMIQNDHGYFLPTDEEARKRRGICEQMYKQWAIEAKDAKYIKDMNCEP